MASPSITPPRWPALTSAKRGGKYAAATQKMGRASRFCVASTRSSRVKARRRADATARAVARDPARVSEELDERVHRRRQLPPAQVDDVPVAADRKALDVQLDQAAGREFERARITRYHRKAKPRFDRVLDGAIGPELHRDHQLDARPARGLFQRPAASRGSLAHDERLVRYVFES